jgi:hypothetical protein
LTKGAVQKLKRDSQVAYWHDVFTLKSWEEFLKAGANVSGYPDRRWKSVQNIGIGDILLCYMKGKSCWFAALEVTSKPYQDFRKRIWSDDLYPSRVGVKVLVKLNPDRALNATQMLGRLKIFEKVRDKSIWGVVLRGAPKKIAGDDGDIIISELRRLAASTWPIEIKEARSPEPYAGERRHEELKRKIKEIGEILGKYPAVEFHAAPYVYDVVWKDAEGLPRPSHVFEVQDKGSVDLALAKLQHARDMWRPKLFLVVTGESDRNKVDLLLRPYLQGAFHGISKDTRVLTGEVIDDLHGPFTEHRDAVIEFVER